jgi:hypothetical protein
LLIKASIEKLIHEVNLECSKQKSAFKEFKPTTDTKSMLWVISETEDGVIEISSRRRTARSTVLDKHCFPEERQTPAEVKFEMDDPGTLSIAVEEFSKVSGTMWWLNKASMPFTNPEP